MRHAFSKLSFLIEFALCQKSSEYLGCLVNRKSGASLPHWLTSKWCKSPGPHWGLLRPPKRCKKMQRKSVLLIFLLNLWNITLIIDVFRHLNANCRRFYVLFVLIFPTQSLCLCLYLRFLMSGSSPPTGILSLWFLLPHWYFFSLSTENANFRLITWWIGFEEQVLYISVLRKPHSMLPLSP